VFGSSNHVCLLGLVLELGRFGFLVPWSALRVSLHDRGRQHAQKWFFLANVNTAKTMRAEQINVVHGRVLNQTCGATTLQLGIWRA
jgi:hypothetical protein